MANYYWVGTGTWDAANNANWAASSGGPGGAGVPTAADAVFFDAASGAVICTLGADVSCLTMNMAGYTGTLAFGANKISLTGSNTTIFTGATTATITGTPRIDLTASSTVGTRSIAAGAVSTANAISFHVTAGSDNVNTTGTNAMVRNFVFTGFSGTLQMPSARQICGDLTLSSTMTVAASASLLLVAARSGGGLNTFTCAGKTLDFPITNDGNLTFADTFRMGVTRLLTLRSGSINANDQSVSIGSFALSAGTKTLTLGSGTWSVAGNWDANTNVANLTVSASTGTINMTSASAKTFAGGAKTWPTLNQGGAGALTIQQSNTFANVTNTVQPATITLTSGTTQTVTSFGVSGTAGNLITLNSSSAGSQATLSDNSGVNSVSYASIKDINATGGSIWDAPTTAGNVDAGNNLGWNFGIPFNYDIEFSPALRSFTERKQF